MPMHKSSASDRNLIPVGKFNMGSDPPPLRCDAALVPSLAGAGATRTCAACARSSALGKRAIFGSSLFVSSCSFDIFIQGLILRVATEYARHTFGMQTSINKGVVANMGFTQAFASSATSSSFLLDKGCPAMSSTLKPNDLDAHFMPFTAQKSFKKKPRMITGAKGMYYYSDDGRELLDPSAGLWCVNAGHSHPKIVEAIQKQAAELDYAPNFSFGHPLGFQAASRLVAEMPGDIEHVFFSNSGSEAVDTAVKIALAYWRARGKAAKTKIISRERAYHGVNICGVSLGGIPWNRKVFAGAMMPNVDYLPHTHNLKEQAYSRHQPEWGGHLANDLENIVALHDAENVAAVIVEPVAGSTGVLVPPKGYLEKLREICTKHDILLIFDEVITGFGRLGKATAAEYF